MLAGGSIISAYVTQPRTGASERPRRNWSGIRASLAKVEALDTGLDLDDVEGNQSHLQLIHNGRQNTSSKIWKATRPFLQYCGDAREVRLPASILEELALTHGRTARNSKPIEVLGML